MMATEATVETSVDASASKPASNADTDSQNVDVERPTVNGGLAGDEIENKHITSVEDQLNSADPSVSGGSDTEASSKQDPTKSQDGEKGHVRTSSTVKKPTTFKAVSVNKTFLAAKGVSSSAAPKAGDIATVGSALSTAQSGGSTLSTTRPRLVAKSGASIRDSVPKFSSAANGGRPGVAPDPSAVWNKNRPAPAPEPKKFTDEELKKYGIHMANRLPADAANGQANWADIDDDDEDWAPETIEWTDGTKNTLPLPDETPAPAPVQDPVPAVVKPLDKPKSPAPVSSSSPSVKPGVLASGKGLILKGGGSADKPTLVAKPPAPPTPVKSPWAQLPPIDKASPVATDLPNSRIPGRDLQTSKGMPPPLAKEIAPDDFSRSWRDGQGNANRELYNSHSGRYEPVPDRRGSRQEPHNRQPALLQRSSTQDQPEPSPAFQTTRAVQDGPFGRRRGSSNVSGGSGSFLQRMVKGSEAPMPPAEVLNVRRASLTGSTDSPVSPQNFSPSGQQAGPHLQAGQAGQAGQPWQARSSPNASHAKPFQNAPNRDGAPADTNVIEDIDYQEKLMGERRKLARERKLAEKAREEEEKQKRIRKKLEELGPAPERKSEKDAAAKDGPSAPIQIQQRESPVPPDSSNQLTGGGLMKTSALSETSIKTTSSLAVGSKPDTQVGSQDQGRQTKAQDLRQNNPWDNSRASQPDRFSGWSSGTQQGSRNVWGSPNNDRGLGNGTFNTELSRAPEPHPTPIKQSGPAPIAPPTRFGPQTQAQPPPSSATRTSRLLGSGGREYSEAQSRWVQAVAENDKALSAAQAAERAERDRQLGERGLSLEKAQAAIRDTWRPVTLPGDGTRTIVQGTASVIRHETQNRAAAAGWDQQAEERPKAGPAKSLQEIAQQDYQPTVNSGGMGSGSMGSGSGSTSSMLPSSGSSASAQPRPSRFFPAKEVRLEMQAPAEPERPNSPSPPPPTMDGHPAYDGDVLHPHVSLPRPQPVVRLPPAPGQSAQTLSGRPAPSFPWTNPASYREPLQSQAAGARGALGTIGQRPHETMGENWQDRINNLLTGRKSSPPKSMVIDPSSRGALDQTYHQSLATVSLPAPTIRNMDISNQTSITTKPLAEECFEEQEMGSLPQIRLPHMSPAALWQPAPAPTKPFPKKLMVSHTTSAEPLYLGADILGGGNVMRIQLPGMAEAKTLSVPFSRTRSNPRRGGQSTRGPRHASSGSGHRGGKARDASSSSYGGEAGSAGGSGSQNRNSRGAFRGRADNWSRQTPPSLPA